jgi:hypothetical protein
MTQKASNGMHSRRSGAPSDGSIPQNRLNGPERKTKISYFNLFGLICIVALAVYNTWVTQRLAVANSEVAVCDNGIMPQNSAAGAFITREIAQRDLKSTLGSANTLETWDSSKAKKNLDIGIPVSAQDEKLDEFVKFLGSSIREFRKRTHNAKVNIRLLITRYAGDVATEEFRQILAKAASLDKASVIFVSATYSKFNRATAINSLHRRACHSKDCVLGIVDVDIQVGPGFIANALSYVAPQKVYFPIVWSEFNPENIKRVETLMGPLGKYNEHRGLWRFFGFGMYAISGADASSMLMNTTFVGWGGEDNDFHSRVKGQNWTIVREEEPDLVHVWHPKYCKVGSFVDKTWYNTW